MAFLGLKEHMEDLTIHAGRPPSGSTATFTNGCLVAVTEFCPGWSTSRGVTDLSGRLVTDISAGSGRQIDDVC
jgi:hypothetical protein